MAIIGGGPAASTLATLLARQGVKVAILHKPRPAALLVGESLVPAIIPILRTLGVEDEVKSYSMFKPGACFNMNEWGDYPFTFKDFCGSLPHYAYNVPRARFEETLQNAAVKAGARIIGLGANLERVEGTDRVRLSRETLAATDGFFTEPPDLIVDATGRARVLPKLLGIPSREGGRKDTALFAHVDRADIYQSGYVHSSRLDHGWSWRIPLPGRVSLGIVIGTEFLAPFGTTPEERYDNLLRQDSVLKVAAAGAKRLTPVMEYSNYQLVSDRLAGDGWVLVGDTAGFIDPVFSSGLLIGITSAVDLAGAISRNTPAAFKEYEAGVIHHLKTWHEIVNYFYDGRLFTCFRVGQMLRNNPLVRLSFPHMNKHLGRIFTGAAAKAPYSMRLLRFAMKHGLKDEDPKSMAIR